MDDIYSERKAQGNASVNVVVKEQPEPIVFIDCDRKVTLLDIVSRVRTLIAEIPEDVPITLYIVRGASANANVGWRYVWEYLTETGRDYNILFRGIFPSGADGVFNYPNLTVYLTKSIEKNRGKSFKKQEFKYRVI